MRALLVPLTAAFLLATAHADDRPILIGKPAERSRVPAVLAQDRFLPEQCISAVDVSGDGRRIAVATMAFRHDRNVWLLSDDGKVAWSRYVAPWAPFQVATTPKGGALAMGFAYSRVTAPFPTIALFQDETSAETALTDSNGETGWLRYGSGDWRTGWLVSSMGDQFVRGGERVLTVTTANGAWEIGDDGKPRKLPNTFPSQRPYRLAASADGRTAAFGYIVPDVARPEQGTVPEAFRADAARALVRIHATEDRKERGSLKPSEEGAKIARLPDPAKDFPELAEKFALRPDAIVPFRVAASIALNADGSRIAVTEYAGWLSLRAGPAIGTWNPPYHVLAFVPRQRGVLRITRATGEELMRLTLPRDGLFDVRLDPRGERAWCYPASWFARGMAGAAWLPTDAEARTVLAAEVSARRWTAALQFPDAVSDFALNPSGDRLLVSCWDGRLYLLDEHGKEQANLDVDGPARLQWSADGKWVIVGTHEGEVHCLDGAGKRRWRSRLPRAELPPLKQPIQRVFEEVPIYQVGRVGPEHAYVGDTWLVKTAEGGILVDTGGTSGIPLTLQRIRSAGVDPQKIRHLLHTHSHGDHCGAGYLWRTMGLKIVAPASADLTLGWLMPTLSDYSVWPPRPVDQPLPLKRAGDQTEITLAGLKIQAYFVPGHSFDSVIYAVELDGKRVVFTGDVGFDNQDILHRCWGDVDKARAVTDVIRTKILPLKPAFVFRGHGAKRDGTAFLEDLVKRSDESIRKADGKR
ncbi:hypothetical protein AYO40_04310 [Planctomycetaceae bacterium SCGC AG-212-D15]|nr:hypothetical protein AYO40_04310 [Planctomycetaceae bacterium SCGC AG-212-D15]